MVTKHAKSELVPGAPADIAGMAATLLAAVMTRPDADIFDPNWMENRVQAWVEQAVTVAKLIAVAAEAAPEAPVSGRRV